MAEPNDRQANRKHVRRDVVVAAACGATVAAMIGAAYAAVPLYNWFCRATGFNGTTQIAGSAPGRVLDRTITVRFDANVGPGLPWKFMPEQTAITVKLGEVVTVNYLAINESARPTAGLAAYNVTPLSWGAYFQKINCFCFTEQYLAPGEKREMAVVFYVDPALAQDADAERSDAITLSYTFFPDRNAEKSASNKAGGS